MNGFVLVLPILFIRYGLLAILGKEACRILSTDRGHRKDRLFGLYHNDIIFADYFTFYKNEIE